MFRKGFALKSLGLSIVVVGALAFAVGLVGAEAGANWTIELPNGTRVDAATLNASVGVNELEPLGGTGERDGRLVSQISGKSVEIVCKNMQFSGVKVEAEGKVASGAKVKFTSCTVKVGGKLEKECTPFVGAETEVILTNSLKGLIVLHNGAGLTKIEPTEKETLAFVLMNEECPIGEKMPINGIFTVKDASSLAMLLVKRLASEGPLTDMWLYGKTAEHKATLSGTAILQLTGAHEGFRWSGNPA
jgi:hypothetical protein